MVIRNIVRQLETPDRLRGRMIGVNMVFFQGGPQLGELEAGAVANWLGPVFSVVSGGIGCLIATGWVAMTTPALRHYRRSATRPGLTKSRTTPPRGVETGPSFGAAGAELDRNLRVERDLAGRACC